MESRTAKAATFFDQFAAAFDTLYDEKRGRLMRWVDRRFRSDMFERFARTFSFMSSLSGRAVLDIGCGSGPYLQEALRRDAKHVTGVDPAPGMLRLARQRLDDAGCSDRCDLIEAAFPGVQVKPHDYAIVMGVFDYVDEPEAFLRALRPLVHSGVAASFPSRHWFRTPLRKFRYWLRNCPVFFYTEQQIRDLAAASGFSSAEIYKIPGAGMDYHVCLIP